MNNDIRTENQPANNQQFTKDSSWSRNGYNSNIDLKEVAEKIEVYNSRDIFYDFTQNEKILLGKKCFVRAYDCTKHPSEFYYPTGNKNKATIRDFKLGKTYFAINLFRDKTGLNWREAVIELGKRFGYIPHDYEPNIKFQKREFEVLKQPTAEEIKESFNRLISPIIQDWNNKSLEYWLKFGITKDILLKYNVFSLKEFTRLNEETGETSTIKPKNAYLYQINKEVGKKYQPEAPKKSYKWGWVGQKDADDNVIWGLDQLPQSCKVILIVEGLKDCMAVVANFSEFDIYAIGLDSAAQKISQETINVLRSKTENLILCLDNDEAGKENNLKKSQLFNLPILNYFESFDGKDFADLCENLNKYGGESKIIDWILDKPQQPETQQPAPDTHPAASVAIGENEVDWKLDYARIGTKYYKKVQIPTKYGFTNSLEKWDKDTIKDDFSTKNNKAPYLDIERFDAFCNSPDNINYQRRIVNCYNIYSPLPHIPQKGDFSKTEAFLKHIFGEKFDVGLDYITILYKYPKQILPILCLVSKERGTGKTTFLKWLKMIFADNCVILGNRELESEFNSHYATKLIIGVDETKIETHKREVSERIKKLATDETALLQFKGVDSKEIAYFGKLIMCSNHEDNFIEIDQNEVRYFVNKVHPFESDENTNLENELLTEIPAFLYFILNRETTHPNKTRAWFDYEVIKTEALKIIVEETKNPLHKAIDEYLEDCFMALEVDKLEMSAKDIWFHLVDEFKFLKRNDVEKYIKSRLGKNKAENQTRYSFFNLKNYQDTGIVSFQEKNGRIFTFYSKDWMKK